MADHSIDRAMPPALPATARPSLPAGYYALGGSSFIPLLGVLTGIVSIVIGLSSRRRGGKRLALLGASGIAFSVILYGSLFYFGFVQRGGLYDGLRAQMAQSSIDALVPQIEFYRLQHGHYPMSLEALRTQGAGDALIMTADPSTVMPRPFYYRPVGDDHYYLRGLGADGKVFSTDDLLPRVVVPDGSRIGLLVRPLRTVTTPVPAHRVDPSRHAGAVPMGRAGTVTGSVCAQATAVAVQAGRAPGCALP